MHWLLSTIVFFSVSLHSPNIKPNPFDYEISVGARHQESFYFNRQWERELNIEYIDEEYWLAKSIGPIYLREKYLNKESNSFLYNQFDLRYKKSDLSIGYALRHNGKSLIPSHNLVIGHKFDKNFNILVAKFNLNSNFEILTNFKGLDYSINLQVSAGLLQNINTYAKLRYEKQSIGNEFYQFKIGLEYELPNWKKGE